ncbi:MAG: glutathione S-transferase family protein [Proteobacteria bacterium]|nr:glutathione S-transferase family protein [Pseudomonadota bacterium]MDA1058341.1 glutathione S-transferase family protein [Pseudomonadota bacterium]
MATVEIFSAEVCPYAHRTRLVLMHKKIDFSLTEIDLKNKPAWFPDVSPYGKVPSIRHDGQIVYESAVVNEYLDEVFPTPALMPSTPHGRAMARVWVDYGNTRFNGAAYKLLRATNPVDQGPLREELDACLLFMENEGLRKSGDGPYWFGAEPSLVDFSYYPFFERFCNVEHYRNYEMPAGCTRLRAWVDTMKAMPIVREIANPPAFYIERAKAYAAPAQQAAE